MAFDLVYLYHSGFALCFDNFSVLIDFYEDSADARHGFAHDKLPLRSGPLYILSSHFHSDHFCPEIFTFAELKEDTRYIFSKDIWKRRRQWLQEDDIAFLSEGDVFADEFLKVKAYDSTDSGVSFYIEAAGYRLFHAGDLNNWHWRNESTAQEAEACEKAYLTVLRKIRQEVDFLDLAMFPVDPRLGSDYDLGAEQFIDTITCAAFAPMHFWGQYAKAQAFAPKAEAQGCRFIDITERGQIFHFDKPGRH